MGNAVFVTKAPKIMQALMDKYGLRDYQAAGIVGNLGRESLGLTALHEFGQPANRGGYGWAQWTGPRRRLFLAWCAAHKLDWKSDDANLGYLFAELDGDYRRIIPILKTTVSLEDATRRFEQIYEAAGVPAMASRIAWARIALRAYRASKSPIKPA